jgi:hypothetical protein
MAMPTSAAASAGASLMPSPTLATLSPSFFQLADNAQHPLDCIVRLCRRDAGGSHPDRATRPEGGAGGSDAQREIAAQSSLIANRREITALFRVHRCSQLCPVRRARREDLPNNKNPYFC